MQAQSELRQRQYACSENADFCLHAARAIVVGKIANQRLLLKRYYRFRPQHANDAEPQLAEMQAQAKLASDLAQLRGYEGLAARSYFAAWAALLPEAWPFAGRSKNPPGDPVNALLSYSYGVLFHNLLTLVVQRGLDPYLGSLHAVSNRHPALVSDLMEEFRPLVADVAVISLLQENTLRHQDFSLEGNRCLIAPHARRQLLGKLEDKLNGPLTHPHTGQSMDYRRAMRQQVAHWAAHVGGQAAHYRPCTLR